MRNRVSTVDGMFLFNSQAINAERTADEENLLPSPSRFHGPTYRGFKSTTLSFCLRIGILVRFLVTTIFAICSYLVAHVGTLLSSITAACCCFGRALGYTDIPDDTWRLSCTSDEVDQLSSLEDGTSQAECSSTGSTPRLMYGKYGELFTPVKPEKTSLSGSEKDGDDRHANFSTNVTSVTVHPLPSPASPEEHGLFNGDAQPSSGDQEVLLGSDGSACFVCGYTLEDGQPVVMARGCDDRVKVSAT